MGNPKVNTLAIYYIMSCDEILFSVWKQTQLHAMRYIAMTSYIYAYIIYVAMKDECNNMYTHYK